MLRTCGLHSEDFEKSLEKCRHYMKLSKSSNDNILYVNVKYFILHSKSEEDLPLTKLKLQHSVINQCYNGRNLSSTRVPKTGKYAFSDVIGVPGVVFLPENSENLTERYVTRIKCSEKFKTLQDVLDFLGKYTTTLPGSINIIFAPLSGILGQSMLGENVTTVDCGTVGDVITPGKLMEFGQGMTLVHELGHVFQLTHTWNSTKPVQVMPDIPMQRYPNHTFKFIENEDTGEQDGSMCNRMRDCQAAQGIKTATIQGKTPPYSWLSTLKCDSEPFEMGCNFMDYASDQNMAMFSKSQAQVIRGCVMQSKYKADIVSNTVENASKKKQQQQIQSLTNSSAWWHTWEAVGFGTGISIGILLGAFGIIFENLVIGLVGFGISVLLAVIFVILVFRSKKTSTISNTQRTTTEFDAVRLTSITQSSASITWPIVSGVSVWSVYLNEKKVTETHDTTFDFKSLDAANTYIVSIKHGSITAYSITIVTLPNPPESITASEQTYTSFRLKWSSPNQGTARLLYNVYQDDVVIASTEATSLLVNNLISGFSYNFSVSAQTTSGESTRVSVLVRTLPEEIRNLKQIDSQSHSIVCEFENPANGYYTSFNVYVNSVLTNELDTQQQAFSVLNLSPATTYTLCIKSISSKGVESLGTYLTVSTFKVVPPPISVTAQTDSSGATLTVTAPDETTLYSYYVHGYAAMNSTQQHPYKFRYVNYTPTSITSTCTIFVSYVPNSNIVSNITFGVFSTLKNEYGLDVQSSTFVTVHVSATGLII